MTIAIIGGTGPEGSGLALRWASAGEKVIIGSRSVERAAATAANITGRNRGAPGVQAGGTDISGTDNSSACNSADIVVLTVPFEAHAETLKDLKPSFRSGQILVDTTVPLAASVGGKPTQPLGVWQGSAAVAAFHNVCADCLHQDDPVDCDVIVCSDNKEAAKKVRDLARKIPGLRAIDGGKLENARIVEQITALQIGLNIRHKGRAGIRITGLPPQAYDL